METLAQALRFELGYNANLVILGTMVLGLGAGMAGVLLYLRKRALISDAISHATLPGVALAFLVLSAAGLDARSLPLLSVGAALSAGLGLFCVSYLSKRTALGEDTAIGAVLSVFFGIGIVLLTWIQSMPSGQKAGLEGFLLGATASMLWHEGLTILIGSAVTLGIIFVFRRPLVTSIFDPVFAQSVGLGRGLMDTLILGLVLAITVIGLKIVGLILIVALLIIPAVTARFWTDRIDRVLLLAGAIGLLASYIGAALSAAIPDLPAGPIIVLCQFALFSISFFCAPKRGVLMQILRHWRLQHAVHRKQGLLALAHGQNIYEAKTKRLLHREGLVQRDGVLTSLGKMALNRLRRDEARWRVARQDDRLMGLADMDDGVTPIEDIFTQDQLAELDARIPAAEGHVQ